MNIQKITKSLLISFIVATASGCSSALINTPTTDASFSDPKGIPWVESKEYEVRVYAIKKGGESQRVYYGTHTLGDKVNGEIIDQERTRWATNYHAGAFSNASLKIQMHDTGSVKSITVSDDPRIDQAINAAAVPLDLQDNIDSKELERLKRENEIREQRKKLENSQ